MLYTLSKTWRCDGLRIEIKDSLIFIWCRNVDRFDTNLSDFPKSDEAISIWLVFLKVGFTPDFLKTSSFAPVAVSQQCLLTNTGKQLTGGSSPGHPVVSPTVCSPMTRVDSPTSYMSVHLRFICWSFKSELLKVLVPCSLKRKHNNKGWYILSSMSRKSIKYAKTLKLECF